MSQQLTLSSLFSALALAALCVAATHGLVRGETDALALAAQQAEAVPGLPG